MEEAGCSIAHQHLCAAVCLAPCCPVCCVTLLLQCVEIVLTAHPTQVNRRTLQYKHSKIAMLLQQHDRPDLTGEEKEQVLQDLMREIAALWQTDELRRQRPTPVDGESKGQHTVSPLKAASRWHTQVL